MANVLNVKEIFEEIKSNSRQTIKQEIIANNVDNELFMKALYFLANPYIVTGISGQKISKKVDAKEINVTFSECMDYLKENNTGRDEDIKFVLGFINSQPEETRDFLKQFFTKGYSLGIASTNINKVVKNFIPKFDVMLAEGFEKNKDRVLGKDFVVTYKLDGMRVICVKDDSVKFFSRQGKVVDGLVELEEAFSNLPNGVYDGELLAEGEFSESKEIFQETMKRARTKGEKRNLIMCCFDYIESPKDFYDGKCSTSCIDRKNKLEEILNSSNEENVKRFIQYLTPLYIGDDMSQIEVYMSQAMQEKQEGLMINIADAPYECKRVKTLLKCKEFNTVDLKVVGYEEGQGEFVGTLGALLVDYKGYTVKVGSGYSQDIRQQIWDDKDAILDRVIEVKYFEETKNQDGGISLRFPVFVRVREIDKEVSYH